VAEFIRCDRCGAEAAGRIVQPQMSLHAMQGIQAGVAVAAPSVTGWLLLRNKLLCPQCDTALDRFLERLAEHG
jgi:hypothetical protein